MKTQANVLRKGGIERHVKNLNGLADGEPAPLRSARAFTARSLYGSKVLAACPARQFRGLGGIVMKKSNALFAALALVAVASLGASFVPASAQSKQAGKNSQAAKTSASSRVRRPLDLAVLIQDDLVPRVGNELRETREFIQSLPAGSRVMVAYVRSGSLQVRQPFTTDLAAASRALRIPAGSTAVSPYNPYVELRDAIRMFPADTQNRNAVLLVSDGLDTSRGFDFASSVDSVDLQRAVREAKRREVAVYSFYAPTVGLTSRNQFAVSLGQSALNRVSDETGGRAFFQGTSFVTFDAYFERLTRTLNEQGDRAY